LKYLSNVTNTFPPMASIFIQKIWIRNSIKHINSSGSKIVRFTSHHSFKNKTNSTQSVFVNIQRNMSSVEPPAKKQKTGWEDHKLNVSEAIMKADEGKLFSEIATSDIKILQGIGPKCEKVLSIMELKTVSDLATYNFFLMARAITALAETETDFRPSESEMNIDQAVDKAFESKKLSEIVDSPVAALQGLSEEAGSLLNELGVKTVGDLAKFKYCRWAEAIVTSAKYENTMNEAERKKDRAIKRLSN